VWRRGPQRTCSSILERCGLKACAGSTSSIDASRSGVKTYALPTLLPKPRELSIRRLDHGTSVSKILRCVSRVRPTAWIQGDRLPCRPEACVHLIKHRCAVHTRSAAAHLSTIRHCDACACDERACVYVRVQAGGVGVFTALRG
jgi:hypothetical protein